MHKPPLCLVHCGIYGKAEHFINFGACLVENAFELWIHGRGCMLWDEGMGILCVRVRDIMNAGVTFPTFGSICGNCHRYS